MDQLTIRGFDEDLLQRLRDEARREGISLSRAAISLMRRGAGLDVRLRPQRTVGHSLDHLIGTWTQQEADAFDVATSVLAQVDDELWR